ncbi:MAG: hypothetical protein ACRD44_04895 [Bryobacteraceae bacterium]
MIVDTTHLRWVFAAGAIALASAAGYLAYALLAPNGPSAGSWPGLIFAFAGTGVIVFECVLSLRKKYPASPLGRVSSWLRAHIWLGLLSFVLILFHSGMQWGQGLAALLMWIFLLITLSGIFGLVLQNWLPRRMKELVTRETLYDQIPSLVRELRVESLERIEFLTADLGLDDEDAGIERAGGVKRHFEEAQRKSAQEKIDAEIRRRKATPQIEIDENSRQALAGHYREEIRPFLYDKPSGFTRQLFATDAKVKAYFNHLRTVMPVAAHTVLNDLESICEERRQLAVQRRLHRWLHGWLFLHVPLSMGFLVLTGVHAVVSLRY